MQNYSWWTPVMTGQESAEIQKVLDANFLNDGPVTTQLENELAQLLDVKHAVAVTSCTSALFLSLCALNIGPGDEVLIPDITFIATANAVSMTGAKAVPIDIESTSLCMCPEAASKAINAQTKAIIPVHLSGRPANLHALTQLAKDHQLHIIEDAAEALYSFHRGQALGTFGSLGCFSFSPMKMITTGQGGLIVTDDDALHIRLRELKDQGRPVRGTGGDDHHVSIGFNFKLTNLQAAVGVVQLKDLPARCERMREISVIYQRELHLVSGITLLPFNLEENNTPQWIDAIAEHRDELVDYLADRGADTRKFWHPIHRHPPYRESDELFPKATKYASQALWLPSALTLTDDHVITVCQWVKEFYQSKGKA